MKISFAHDLPFDDLQKYLNIVSNDFNPAADAGLGIAGYADKLTRLGRTIAVISNVPDEGTMGIIAGYFNNPDQGFSFISAFHVRPQFRRRHLGKLLMDKAVEVSRDAGFDSVRLKVNKTNVNGIAFYLKYGFVIVNEDVRQFEMSYDINVR
jgi:ribosomal protein S18 acetylase RimI-like enzyme